MFFGRQTISLLILSLFLSHVAAAEVPQDLGEIVVTASRMAQMDTQIPANVTVISQDKIHASGATTVSEILKQEEGIRVYETGSVKSAVIDIRGFGDTASRNVLVLVNDRKVNTMDVSGPDFLQLPLESVERIEISRGAGSVLYGDNAVGGVINIITKKGRGRPQVRVSGSYGNYNTNTQDLTVSGEKQKLSYYFYAKHFDTKGYRTNSDLFTQDFNSRLEYAFTDSLSAKILSSSHQDHQGLPGGLTETELSRLGRRGSADEQDFAKTKDQFVQLSLEADPWVTSKENGYFVADFSYRTRNVYDSFNSFGPFNTKRAIFTKGVTGKYVFDQTIFGRETDFVAGIDFYDSENGIRGSGDNVDDIKITKKEVGGYSHLQYELLDKVFFSGGTRYQQVRYGFDQRNVPVSAKQTPSVWVYQGGMKYEYAEKSNAYVNVQKTFRFLATDEWYSTANFPGFGITPGLNLNLKQQTGLQYETGVKHNLKDMTLLNLTTYVMDNRHEIFFNPTTFANTNYDKTRRIGLEAGQETELAKLWEDADSPVTGCKISTSFTYQNPEFNGGPFAGKKIPFVPVYQVNQGLRLEFKKRYQWSLSGHYVGASYAINDVQNEIPPVKPYFTADTKLTYVLPSFQAFFAVNNLFNEKFYSYVSKSSTSVTKDYFPAPERNFMVGLSFGF